jgi:hypothetical protein
MGIHVDLTAMPKLIEQGDVPTGSIHLSTHGGDHGVDLRLVLADGRVMSAQVKSFTNGRAYTLTTVDVGEHGQEVVTPSARGRASWAIGLLQMSVAVLPEPERQRWLEEWAGELYDLRSDGESWWRRAIHVAAITLRAAPTLAITLRIHARKAID